VSDFYLLLAAAVVLGVVVIALFLLALQRLKRRRAKLLQDLAASPRQAGDRAYNRLEMARREAAILGRQGVDIARAREQIAQSQAAFDGGNYTRAYELAQSAHESMVHARQTGSVGSATPSTAPPLAAAPLLTAPLVGGPGRGGSRTPDRDGDPSAGAAPPPRLAPNRAESQFQMHLLDSDLDAARSSRRSAGTISAVAALRSQAQSAFDSEQYTDALKLALRGRRELGGKVETLAPSPSIVRSEPAGGGDSGGLDAAASAERAASGSRCAQCGYPARPDDAFCRGCGLPRVPAVCPKCGASRTPSDTFCGRCGERFS
jgi:hypothetical protein